MTGIVALYGSGEFTSAMADTDLYILGLTPSPNVAIIPTASGKEGTHTRWIEQGIQHFSRLGIEVAGLEIITRKDADNPKLAKELKNYSCFIISGGDPGYLLQTLQDSLVWDKISSLHKQGATIIGSSAGAMVLAPQVWTRVYDFDEYGQLYSWEPGLNLIDFGVIPHFDLVKTRYSQEAQIAAFNNFPHNLHIVGIDEDTAYIYQRGKWIKRGHGKVYDPLTL